MNTSVQPSRELMANITQHSLKIVIVYMQKMPELVNYWILCQNNASLHKASCIAKFLEEHNIEVMEILPFSPKLVPGDFWMFPALKKALIGCQFHFDRKTFNSNTNLL